MHVIQNLDPAWGGVPMVATRVAAAQAGLGHEVVMACHAPPGGVAAEEPLLAGLPHRELVTIERFEPVGALEGLMPGKLAGRLEGVITGADAVHLHGVWDPILRAAAVAADRAGVRYVITVHGMLDPWSLSQKRAKKRLALAMGYRKMLNGAWFIQAMNEEERRLFEPLGLTSDVRLVPNGIFVEELEPLPAAGTFRRLHPGLGDDPFVLFLSRLHYKKGLDVLADAFAVVHRERPDVRLVVAGPEDEAAGPFREQIARYGLTERVLMPGPVYGEAKLAAFVDAACFCLPSRQEGFSIAITEALALGSPAVITEGCHFDAVAEAGAGLVTALDKDAIGAALLEVLGDAERARAMGVAGKALVRQNYTWPGIAERLAAAYVD
ncbi:glycosyltransferase [Mucisphaera sp.]|uniref:glycosyltransferase n=1 Tax=Mucisphaera sp. TaxID=2913024 RepID=UPI003D0C2111